MTYYIDDRSERATLAMERHKERRENRRRWRAIQDRMDARSYLEHLSDLTDHEPAIVRALATAHADPGQYDE